MKLFIFFCYFHIICFRKVKNRNFGSESSVQGPSKHLLTRFLTFAKSLLLGLFANFGWRFTAALKKVLQTIPEQLFVIRSLTCFELVPSRCLVDDIKLGIIYSFICQGCFIAGISLPAFHICKRNNSRKA